MTVVVPSIATASIQLTASARLAQGSAASRIVGGARSLRIASSERLERPNKRVTVGIKRYELPHWWVVEALCIHRHESTNWHQTTTWEGYPSVDTGGMQIASGTWSEMAPRDYPPLPALATPWQQLLVSYRIWLANGHRFGGSQWPVSSESCGVP